MTSLGLYAPESVGVKILMVDSPSTMNRIAYTKNFEIIGVILRKINAESRVIIHYPAAVSKKMHLDQT